MSEDSTVTATPGHGETATAVVAPSQVVTKTTEHTEASALPELDWKWRRWFVFGLTVALVGLAWRVIEITPDVTTLRMVARYSLFLVALLAMLYIAGASAEGITKLVQAAKTTRKETVESRPAE
jgi:apolipoprotein N-acyltransferase